MNAFHKLVWTIANYKLAIIIIVDLVQIEKKSVSTLNLTLFRPTGDYFANPSTVPIIIISLYSCGPKLPLAFIALFTQTQRQTDLLKE